jgi:glycogen debranching enzyme
MDMDEARQALKNRAAARSTAAGATSAAGQESAALPHAGLRLAPAKTPSIAGALVLKDGDLFFVSEPNGDVPLDHLHATGLYYHDCRFLDGYELRVAGHRLETLVSTAGRGYQSLVELTNPELLAPDGRVIAPLEIMGVKWTRTLDCSHLALHDTISLRNFGHEPLTLPLSLGFSARFQDVFQVRSLDQEPIGTLLPPQAADRRLRFEYRGADGVGRAVMITFREKPDTWKHGSTGEVQAAFSPTIPARGEYEIALTVLLEETESPAPDGGGAPAQAGPGSYAAAGGTAAVRRRATSVAPAASTGTPGTLASCHAGAHQAWRDGQTKMRSSSPLLDAIIERSFRDLYLLRSRIDGRHYYAAGVPWFATLFGRDSIISALQTLAFDPGMARETLHVLAALQGTAADPWREEQPGKILHELRVGELARTRRVPHSPYYGSIDATPLFLILATEYFAWTADEATIAELRPHLDAALRWLDDSLDVRGYLSYGRSAPSGLVNQGWKDSDNGIPDRDGSPAEPPIALVEVQAYAYLARVRSADLYRRSGRSGDAERAAELEQAAAALRTRFNRDFWMEPQGCYALALHGEEGEGHAGESNPAPGTPRQVQVCASNGGHALWAGIATPEQARRVRRRLMRPDMFTGWGIRTLSEKEAAYSPVGYHLGTVWPHDNSLIASGFRRYGFAGAALRVFQGLTRAAMHFDLYRLPELFAGFSRHDYEVPVHYPLASRPQAWSAGAVPYLLVELLGLRPEAHAGRLNVVSPVLPESVDWLELKDLRVANGRIDLRFERTSRGVAVEVQRKDRPLEVIVKL